MPMLFNIYYIKLSKVYEIKMMLNNLLSVNKSIEKGRRVNYSQYIGASLGIIGS